MSFFKATPWELTLVESEMLTQVFEGEPVLLKNIASKY